MRKKLFFVVVFIVSNVFSQTKQETANYIIDKLNMYYQRSNYDLIKFILNDSDFWFEYNPVDNKYEKRRYNFPVWAIQSISLQRDGSLIFYLDNYCTSCKKYVTGNKQKYKTEYYTAYEYGWEYGRQVKREVEKSRRVKDGTEWYNKEENIKTFTFKLKNGDPEEDFIGRFQRAIDHLKTMYPKKPGSSDLFDKDKTTYKETQKQTDLKTIYKETNPTKDKENELDRLLVEARKQYDAGNKTNSRKFYQQALQLDPNNQTIYFNIGAVSQQLNDYNSAKYNYQQALKINPNYKDANLNLAILILSPEVEIVKKMNALSYSDADTKKYKEYEEQRKAMYRQALPYLNKYWQIDKSNAQVNESLKNIYQILGMTRELIELKN